MRARIELENGDSYIFEDTNIVVKPDPFSFNTVKIELDGYLDADCAVTARLMKSVLNSKYGSRGQFSNRGLYDCRPKIEKVIFNEPATIVLWSDNTKTVVKCQKGDTYSKEVGLAMCISKKYFGDKSNFNNVFKKWIPKEVESTAEEPLPTIREMREYIRKHCRNRYCGTCVIHKMPHHTLCHCFDKDNTSDSEIIENYKAIKEWEAEHGQE